MQYIQTFRLETIKKMKWLGIGEVKKKWQVYYWMINSLMNSYIYIWESLVYMGFLYV